MRQQDDFHQAGTVLDGHYRIEDVLGGGGLGITYQATDIALGVKVAIKELFPAGLATRDRTRSLTPLSDREGQLFERVKAGFLREARTFAQLDHPSIVRVIGVFEAHGTAFMVMRFEEGVNLKEWSRGLHRAPTQAELDRITAQLLDALDYLHARGFLHRNLAPDNIIVRRDGTPVLIDFGASHQVFDQLAGTAVSAIGEHGYFPMEQYTTDPRLQGPWSDIYALAATLYQVVTDNKPTGASARSIGAEMQAAAESFPGELRRSFAEGIDAGLELRPENRPQTIGEWHALLFEGTEARPSPAGAAARPSRTAQGAARNRSASPAPTAAAPRQRARWPLWPRATTEDARPSPHQPPSRPPGTPPRRSAANAVNAVLAVADMSRSFAAGHRAAPAASVLRRRASPAWLLWATLGILGLAATALLGEAAKGLADRLQEALRWKLNLLSFFGLRLGRARIDRVDCSVFAPSAAPPGATVLVQVFLHVPEQAEQARRVASIMDPEAAPRGTQTLQADIARGTEVSMTISAPGLAIDEPQQSVIWRGHSVFCQFLLTLPSEPAGGRWHPVVRLSVGGGLVGRIAFRLEAQPAASAATSQLQGDARRYQHAFLSYASPDRREVLKRAQVLEATGVSYFQDVLSLDPGSRWQREIYRNIDDCDLFLLFWSRAASQSEWVVKEAEYALARQAPDGAPDIVPVILETPPPQPPPSLSGIHFNDRVHYLIAAS